MACIGGEERVITIPEVAEICGVDANVLRTRWSRLPDSEKHKDYKGKQYRFLPDRIMKQVFGRAKSVSIIYLACIDGEEQLMSLTEMAKKTGITRPSLAGRWGKLPNSEKHKDYEGKQYRYIPKCLLSSASKGRLFGFGRYDELIKAKYPFRRDFMAMKHGCSMGLM